MPDLLSFLVVAEGCYGEASGESTYAVVGLTVWVQEGTNVFDKSPNISETGKWVCG